MTNILCLLCAQYFADRDIFCAGRVAEEDLQRVAAATGGTVQTTVNNVIDEVLPLYLLPIILLGQLQTPPITWLNYIRFWTITFTLTNWIIIQVLGSCELFEEKQVGNERFNIFSGCPSGKTATIVLRGGADQVFDHFSYAYNYYFIPCS